MRASRAASSDAPGGPALHAARGLRRARAALRLHRERLVAVLLAAGILLMTWHWG